MKKPAGLSAGFSCLLYLQYKQFVLVEVADFCGRVDVAIRFGKAGLSECGIEEG
jgi:hypothetical protein